MLWLEIGQLILAVLLIGSILLQSKGAGLSQIFGGTGNIYRTKRGVEKMLFHFTIALAVIFFGSHLLNLFIS